MKTALPLKYRLRGIAFPAILIALTKGRIENPFANRAGNAIPLNGVDGCLCVYPKEQKYRNKFFGFKDRFIFSVGKIKWEIIQIKNNHSKINSNLTSN
jgi:hypothetical protein